ncbi:alpha-L-fucosidase-like [Trichoplusia ni]|uniref:Putative alpha-L-fucosidase n=1 Tax=Trichoplusia ni TaxID=7111 RepID=A0A7E5WRD8_TRINI|nr:alpha-L-fucosidase-like [Trichoplusia ni]XP_026742727.1 alpha-L-fucosidase-like [Trichoplusia ni]
MLKLLILSVFICLANASIRANTVVNNFENEVRQNKRYKPIWSDLDTRPLPEWYDKAKIGIFIHWGVFSVPSFGSEWFWINWKASKNNKKYIDFMKNNYPPGFTYQEFAPMFTAEFFDPTAWAQLFAKSGAKYVVLTSKHHEGFTLFPSNRSFSWNAVDVGPGRDLVGELADAVRSQNLKFGVYHSLFEWFNPIYLEDKRSKFATRTYTETKLWPDIRQLINKYKPSVLWSDGDWEAHDDYWRSTDLLAWLYNDSPVKDEIVVNDRWGIDIPGKHGDFYNYQDRYNPGKLLKHKWENAFTVDSKSWGYRRQMSINEVFTINQILNQVVSTVSCGGNVLINIGPTKEGTIIPVFQERLLALGEWLSINGEAIYGSSPWHSQNDTINPKVWYTCTKTDYNASHPTAVPSKADRVTAIYAVMLKWPQNSVLNLADVTAYLHSGTYKVEMLGNEGQYLNWNITNGQVQIQLPDKATVVSQHAWTLRFNTK